MPRRRGVVKRVEAERRSERGSPVIFHDADAIAWSERTQGGPVFRQNHVWVSGCWFVWADSEDVGLIVLSALALSEAVYSAGARDGLFDTCAPTPTATRRVC